MAFNLKELATQHNSLPHHHKYFKERQKRINNTDYYYTGDNICHMKTIQMVDFDEFEFLFGKNLNLKYAYQAIEYFQNRDVPDPGQLEISMLMERNFRAPGIHLAILLIHLFPHRQFHDGHIVQIEFQEGSFIHQEIERLFDTETRAVIEQASQHKILSYIAEEDEMLDLLHRFLVGFNPMKFSFDGNKYFENPDAEDNHRPHPCCDNELEQIMNGLQEIDQIAGADAEVNQAFIEDEEEIEIINNDFIFDRNIINNDLNYYIYNYIYSEPELNFRVQG